LRGQKFFQGYPPVPGTEFETTEHIRVLHKRGDHLVQNDKVRQLNMTIDFERAREKMVTAQLMARGIRDQLVLEAMRKVPRHLFVQDYLQDQAYEDRPLPIALQQTISQPYMVALMTEALELDGGENVLEIGTGSGYQAAVLAEICEQVYTVEKYPELLKTAAAVFRQLGYDNIVAKSDDGTLGWPEHGPFDAILVTAGAPHVPQPLLDQLTDGGRLVIPVGGGLIQELIKLTRRQEEIVEERLIGCQFVPLRGKYGWQ
jgi:protein-L-isoaspartate(D-aspartate) O-methyltransferase